MKYFPLYCLLIFSSLVSYSQIIDSNPPIPVLPLTANKIVYTAKITLDTSRSKQQLFHNAEKWYTHNFETADNTLTIDNIDDGTISGTGIIHAKNKERQVEPGDLFFTVDIKVYKGGYEYKIYSIYSIDETGKFYYSDMYNEALYPLSKTKWTKTYKSIMLSNMNNRITQLIAKMQTELE